MECNRGLKNTCIISGKCFIKCLSSQVWFSIIQSTSGDRSWSKWQALRNIDLWKTSKSFSQDSLHTVKQGSKSWRWLLFKTWGSNCLGLSKQRSDKLHVRLLWLPSSWYCTCAHRSSFNSSRRRFPANRFPLGQLWNSGELKGIILS